MSSRFIYEFSPVAEGTPSASSGTSPAHVVSICKFRDQARAVESQPETPDVNSLGCVRGICAAFVIEGGAALLVYGLWHLWRSTH